MARTMQGAFIDASYNGNRRPRPRGQRVQPIGTDAMSALSALDRRRFEQVMKITKHRVPELDWLDIEDAVADALVQVVELFAERRIEARKDVVGLLIKIAYWRAIGRRDHPRQVQRRSVSIEEMLDKAGEAAALNVGFAEISLLPLELRLLKEQLWHELETTSSPYPEIGARFGLSEHTMRGIVRSYREMGLRRPDPKTGQPRFWHAADHVVEVIKAWAAEHGRTPQHADAYSDPDLPTPPSVVHHCGSWAAGLEAAGLTPGKGGYPKQDREAKRREVAERLAAFAEEHGYWPGQKEMNAANGLPSSQGVRRWFGTNSADLLRPEIEAILADDDQAQAA